MVKALMTKDIDGVAAQELIDTLIEGYTEPYGIVWLASRRLNKKIPGLIEALLCGLIDRHQLLLNRVRETNCLVVAAIMPYQEEWYLLQTIPVIDTLCAAMSLAKISPHYELLWRLYETALMPGS
jgi:transposase